MVKVRPEGGETDGFQHENQGHDGTWFVRDVRLFCLVSIGTDCLLECVRTESGAHSASHLKA